MGVMTRETLPFRHWRMYDHVPLGLAFVALVTECAPGRRKHPPLIATVRVVAGGAPVFKDRVDMGLFGRLAIVAFETEGGTRRNEHPLGFTGVGVVTGGALTLGNRGVQNLPPFPGIVVAGQAEFGASGGQHPFYLGGVRVMADGAAILKSGMDRWLIEGFIFVAVQAERLPLPIEEKGILSLMRVVTTRTPFFKNRVEVTLARRITVVTFFAKGAPFMSKGKPRFFIRVVVPRRFMADRTRLCRHRAVNVADGSDNRMTLRGHTTILTLSQRGPDKNQ